VKHVIIFNGAFVSYFNCSPVPVEMSVEARRYLFLHPLCETPTSDVLVVAAVDARRLPFDLVRLPQRAVPDIAPNISDELSTRKYPH
jgi:hypothetical protein